jgi:hypothetical protein
MENKLIIEINQIRSNMGLPIIIEDTNILLESPTSTLGTILTSILRSSRSVIRTEFSAAEKVLLKKVIKGEITDSSDEVIKLEFSNLMKTPKGVKAIKELRDAVTIAKNNGKINQADEIVFNNIIKDMEKTSTTWAKTTKVLDKTFAKLGGLTAKDVQWLEKVHGKNWTKPFYSFFNSVTGMFKSEEKLLTETLELIKQISLDKGSVNIANYRKQISLNFEKLTKMRIDNFSRINDWITTNVPRDVRLRLDKENLNGYGKAKKLATGDFKVAFDKEYGSFKERIDRFWSQFWAVTIPTKGRISERWGSKSKLYNDLRKLRSMNQSEFTKTNLKELKADFWLGSTLTPAVWRKYISGAGLVSAAWKYLTEYAVIYFKINTAIATLELLIDAGAKGIEDWEFFKNYKWVHDLSMNFNKNYAKAKGLGSIEEFEEYKKNHDNLKLEGGELALLWVYYLKDQFYTLESFIPGMWDNSLKGLYDFVIWYTDPNTKIDNEESKKRIEDANKDIEEAKKRLRDKEKEVTDSIQNIPLPVPDGNKPVSPVTPEEIDNLGL